MCRYAGMENVALNCYLQREELAERFSESQDSLRPGQVLRYLLFGSSFRLLCLVC